MNKTREYINNHPKETKRIMGITYEQLRKLIEKAQRIEKEKKQEIAKTEKRLIKCNKDYVINVELVTENILKPYSVIKLRNYV